MGHTNYNLLDALHRLDTSIDTQRGRVGLMQRWLNEQGQKIDALTDQLDAGLARIDRLLARRGGQG